VLFLMEHQDDIDFLYEKGSELSRVYRRLEACGKPVVAAINGAALGGGLELCLACHYRVVANDARARLGLPEVTLGLLPGAGGTQRLPRLVGLQTSLEMMTQGKSLDPQQALDAGVVHELVEPDELVVTAKRWILDGGCAEQPWDQKHFRMPGGSGLQHPKALQILMAGNSLTARATQHNYPAPLSILSCVYEGTVVPFETGLRVEAKYFAQLLAHPVARNMVRTLFINKKAADRLERRPPGVDRSRVSKVGILGAGMMGAGIASVSAQKGINVVLLDQSEEDADRGKQYVETSLQKRIEKGRLTPDAANEVLERIHTTSGYADLQDSDLIIEAVFENRDIKANVTKQAEAQISADAIFASNTSTLPITGLATVSERPENFIGLHFFSPVERMPLVEVIIGEKTSHECIARALDYVQQLRKTPILVNDSRGFFTTRVFSTYTNEGMTLLQDGVAPALIENAARQAGMAVGPLTVADEVTIELAHKILQQEKEDLGDAYSPPSAIAVIDKMHLELQRSGKRFGQGFYEYPDDGKKYLWPGLADHFPLAASQPDVDEVKKRLLYIQALETARCLEAEVITAPADGDIGSILGWGFPAWTGGTLSLIETVGVQNFVAECDRLAETYGDRFAVPDNLRQMATIDGRFYLPADAPEYRESAPA